MEQLQIPQISGTGEIYYGKKYYIGTFDEIGLRGDVFASAEQFGRLAEECGFGKLPLRILKNNAGYYIGTVGTDGPVTRESEEYWPTALETLEAMWRGHWSPRSLL